MQRSEVLELDLGVTEDRRPAIIFRVDRTQPDAERATDFLRSIPDTVYDRGARHWRCPLIPETLDRKSTRLNSSHSDRSRMPSSA